MTDEYKRLEAEYKKGYEDGYKQACLDIKDERDKLLADKEETIEALREFIALHPSLFQSPYRRVHAKLKKIAEKEHDS